MTSTTLVPVRSSSCASTLACVGVCGYLVGLALPLARPFDLPLVFLVLLAAAAAAVMGLREPRSPGSPAVIPVLGFVLARLLSSLAAPNALRSLQLLAPFLPALLLFFVLSEWIETRRQMIAIYVCLALTGFVLAATPLVESWRSDTADAEAWARGPSRWWSKNDITVLAPLALTVAWLRPRPLIRLGAMGFFALLVSVIVLVQSRTAFVTTVGAVGAFAALAGRRAFAHRKHVPLMLLGGVALIALIADACLGFRFAHKVTHDWRGSGRFALWATALSMFQSAPLLGHGPSSFVWLGADAGTIPWAHNLYLKLLAEEGAVGLLCFLGLIGVGLVMLARVVRSRRPTIAGVGSPSSRSDGRLFELSLQGVWVTIVLFILLGLLTTIGRSEKRGSVCATH
jgi:O-antigen ligase